MTKAPELPPALVPVVGWEACEITWFPPIDPPPVKPGPAEIVVVTFARSANENQNLI